MQEFGEKYIMDIQALALRPLTHQVTLLCPWESMKSVVCYMALGVAVAAPDQEIVLTTIQVVWQGVVVVDLAHRISQFQ
jgi:hypothetical protein